MCQIIAHHLDVIDGTPSRRYRLTIRVGDDQHQEIRVEDGLGGELIQWRKEWGRYMPTAAATIDKAIEEFHRRRGLALNRFEQANAELATAGKGSNTEARRRRESKLEDRQLPAGDRT